MLRVCVQGTIASTPIKFLVDTGAAVSLLSSRIWREIENTRVPIVMQPWLGKKLMALHCLLEDVYMRPCALVVLSSMDPLS